MAREEQYVNYKTAKLLKEKGFGLECNHYYDEIGRTWFEDILCDWNHRTTPEVSCPTQQMACRWLREEYKIFIEVGVGTDIDGVFGYMPSIYFLDILACNEGRFSPNVDADYICDFTPQTYEDAIEVALKYVLTNLI